MSYMQKRITDDDSNWVDVDDFGAPAQNSSRPAERRDAEDFYRGTDFLSDAGARELKRRIEAYWRDKGYDVRVTFEEGAFHPAVRSGRQDVRSDMVNGLPQRKLN